MTLLAFEPVLCRWLVGDPRRDFVSSTIIVPKSLNPLGATREGPEWPHRVPRLVGSVVYVRNRELDAPSPAPRDRTVNIVY